MTHEEIFHTFNYSFGSVVGIQKKGKSCILHFNPENEDNLAAWDEFYEDLDQYEKLYVDKTPRQEGVFHGNGILYYKESRPDCWEVRYARKTSPRINATPRKRTEPVRQCTCSCSCGARLGISI